MTQTALQTLISWGDEMLKNNPNKILSFAEAIDKAQELLVMEKEQIKDAYWNGTTDIEKEDALLMAEDFYNDYYKK